MKFGFRTPSLKKRLSARVSIKRMIRHRAGLKMPRGYGFLTNPRRALYNRVYRRTSFGLGFAKGWLRGKDTRGTLGRPWVFGAGMVMAIFVVLFGGVFGLTVVLCLAGYYLWNRNK